MNIQSKIVNCLVIIFCFIASSLAYIPPQNSQGWKHLNQQIMADLKSADVEDQIYGLKQIIHYGRHLSVCEAKYDILHIFVSSTNNGYRQLALMALYRICDGKDLDFIAHHYQYEQDPIIGKRMRAILREANYPFNQM